MQKIKPFVWFERDMDKILEFYQGVFSGDLKIVKKVKMGGTPSGEIEVVDLSIHGSNITFMTAGPYVDKNPAISFSLSFENEAALKNIWDKLALGGQVMMELQKYPFAPLYGWLSDKWGVSWQLIYLPEANFPKFYPALMFTQDLAGKASEAIDFYTTLFPDSKVLNKIKYGAGGGDNPEYLSHAEFSLAGQFFIALDSSAPHKFKFSDAISLVINVEGQDEVDFYWDKLTQNGGRESQCGWCRDKFGVSWQVLPKELGEATDNSDQEISSYAVKQMLEMKKIIIKDLYR